MNTVKEVAIEALLCVIQNQLAFIEDQLEGAMSQSVSNPEMIGVTNDISEALSMVKSTLAASRKLEQIINGKMKSE